MLLTSRTNAAVKRIRALRRRKERDAAGLCYVEGIRLVTEAAELKADFDAVIVAPDLLDSPLGREVAERLEADGVARLDVSADVFASLSSKDGPQGIAAVVRQQWEGLDALDPVHDRLWVALADTQDPGNLGTILRTSDAVGSHGVILLGTATDPYDPAAVRASMGAIFSQRLVRSSAADFLAWKRQTPFFLVGAADSAPTDFRSVAYRFPLILLMGSERAGLSHDLQASCDAVAAIPMVGRSDSLNLAVATGVMLYEICNQGRHND